MQDLDAQGRWLTSLKTTSNPYVRDSSADNSDVAATYVGDLTDTSPYPNPEPLVGVATDVFVKIWAFSSDLWPQILKPFQAKKGLLSVTESGYPVPSFRV
jgi:hypothetical protein